MYETAPPSPSDQSGLEDRQRFERSRSSFPNHESLNSLAEDRSDTGGAFGFGDSPKLFWSYPSEWNSRAFQSSNEFSGGRVDKKLLAVEQGFE